MAAALPGLSKFSTDQLLAEITRRRDARISRRPIVKCDECRHFVFYSGASGEPPASYNPCAKRHVMSFRHPEADDGPPDQNDDWGHYRRVCADRQEHPDMRWPMPPADVRAAATALGKAAALAQPPQETMALNKQTELLL